MKMNPWKLTTFLFAGLFGATVALSAVQTASADPQPSMRDALKHLKAAAKALDKATPDKGGHRVKAIELTTGAIAETEAGIAYDNHH